MNLKVVSGIALGAMVLMAGVVNADVRVLDPVPQQEVKVGGYWRSEFRKLSVEWLPHCVRMMEKGGRGEELLNLVAAGEVNAGRPAGRKFRGCVFSDAYPYNAAEAICLALEIDPGNDREWRKSQEFLRGKLEEWIKIFLAAQEPSGYIHSFHVLTKHPHFTRVHDHEFYVMGYFIEMGVAHMRMTKGKDRRLFDAAKRCADHLDSVFGPAPKRTWCNGHAGIEYAFLRLADACEKWDGQGKGEKYAKLAQFFIRHQHEGAKKESSFAGQSYFQCEKPAEQMTEATGHAVRACYFYTAMQGIANRLDDKALGSASDKIFANAIDRKSYITGGVGARHHDEAFGPDYWLPLNGYCEACAACGMSFWCLERHAAGAGAITEDVRERLLYNAVGGAISEDGRNFLYQNPPNGRNRHYPWHGCPCCIGNIPRTLFALKDTMYSFACDGKTLYVDHFVESESRVTLGGKSYRMKMTTTYPNGGGVALEIVPKPDFAVVVRFPDRCESKLYVATPAVEHGYRTIAPSVNDRKDGARYSWSLPLPMQQVKAIDQVVDCRGRTAVQRGPIVYAREGAWGDEIVPFHRRLSHGGFSAVWNLDRPAELAGGFGCQTWSTAAEYRNLEIKGVDGAIIWQGLPEVTKCEKQPGGAWSVADGVLRQTNAGAGETLLTFGPKTPWRDCTVRFQARCVGGAEGFGFHVRNEGFNRSVWVNIGGWGNTQHAIEVRGYGCYKKEVVTKKGRIEPNRWYDVEIRCVGDTVAVSLDGKQLFAPKSIPCGDFR